MVTIQSEFYSLLHISFVLTDVTSFSVSNTPIPSASAASSASSSSPSSSPSIVLPPGVVLPPGFTLLALPSFFPVTSTPGTLWFALVLQPFVIFELVSALCSNTLRAHTPLITTFASMVIVLAAIGVDDNLYSPAVSQKLTTAGWMMTAIIDCVWLLCLLAAEGTRMRRVFDFLIGHGGLTGTPTALDVTANVFQNRFTSALGHVYGTRLRRSHRKEPSDIPVPGSVPGSPTVEKNHDTFVVTSSSPPPTPPADAVRMSKPQRASSILSGRVLSIIGGGTPASSVSQLVTPSGLKALALYPCTFAFLITIIMNSC